MRLYADDESPESSILTEPSSSGIGIAPAGGPAPSGGGAPGPQEDIGVWQAMKESFLPVAKAKSIRLKEREAERTELTAGIKALQDGIELSLGADGDQRSAFVKAYKAKLDKFDPELGAAFENLAANPETAGSIVQWGEESETLKRAIQAGGIKGAKKLLTSPEALKTIQAEIDTKRMPLLLRKGQTFVAGWQQLVPPEMVEQFNKDGRISASELISANEWIKTNKPDVAKALAFTDRDLEVVGRNSEAFFHSLGIVSPKDEGAILVDKAKGENKVKPAPTRNQKMTVNGKVVDQPQEWDGQKWVNKGEATPHFKPGDDEAEAVKVELKLSDDYRADTKKFAERRPLFDSATDYFAKRGQKPENKTSAGDAALMFAYAKMRDPNDRLAVSETRDLVKLGNIFERFGVSVQGILEKGETLPDRVAKEMYAEIRRSFTEQNRQQLRVEADYRKKTKDYKGNPDRVVRSYAIPENELTRGNGDRPIDKNRPKIENPDGSFSTERTITVESDGKHYLIPTIVGGKQVSEKQAISAWRGGRNTEVGVYDTAEEADAAAKARSSRIGKERGVEPSQADLEFTAKKHGITVEEVKRRLKAGKK